jgi:antitoxin component of MazEF toxin-antitoxin module
MDQELLQLTSQLKRQPPASNALIREVGASLAVNFPEDYVEWLTLSNGGSGKVGAGSYLLLRPVDKLASHNDLLQVKKFAPGFIFFGSDGGGEGYAFDNRQAVVSIVQMPFIGMSPEVAKPCGKTFKEFLQYLSMQ